MAAKAKQAKVGKSVSVLRWALLSRDGALLVPKLSSMPITFNVRDSARFCKCQGERVVRVRVTVEVVW